MKIGDFTFTRHAIQRALDMAVDPAEIRHCLLHPMTKRKAQSHPGIRNFRDTRITCCVDADNAVVTILWTGRDNWEKDLVGIGTYGGREFRG